jgi:hypothetical protein
MTTERKSVQRPTFDEELLLWLEDEPAEVREADADRVRTIAEELARGFDALAGVGRAVTVFGSARTPREHPDYALVREVAACLGRAGWAVITGGGPGLMEAANRGARDAGRGRSVATSSSRTSSCRTPISTSRCASGTSSPARSCLCATPAPS